MVDTFTIPGPETIVLFGVHIKVLSAIFGIGGIFIGHLSAPTPPQPIAPRRQAAVLAGGVLVAIALTIATGQRPLIVLAWCIGIGFAGIAIYQIWGSQAQSAVRTIGNAALDELSERLGAHKDKA